MSNFGENLREQRKNKGLTQTQLAQLVGTSQGTIWQYETSMRTPKNETIKKIAKVLDVAPAVLDNDLSIDLGNDSIYQSSDPDGSPLVVPVGSPEDRVLNLLHVLTSQAADEWIALGNTLAQYSTNRKDKGNGLKPES